MSTALAARRTVPWGSLITVALPVLVLAALGSTHSRTLTDEGAQHWRDAHLLLLPVFPLLGLGPWLVARRASPAAGVVCAVLGYVYGVFYTALDVLAGIGAGTLQLTGRQNSRVVLFEIGDDLAAIGTAALLAATVVATVAAVARARRRPLALVGGVLAVAAAVSFLSSHVFWPVGVITVLVLGAGYVLLLVSGGEQTTRPKQPRVASPSRAT